MKLYFSPIFPALLGVFLVSCSGPQLKLLDRPITATGSARKLTSATDLAGSTIETLKAEDLWRTYRKDSDAAIRALASRYHKDPTPALRLALAETSSDAGDLMVRSDVDAALGHYLDAAQVCEKGAKEAIGSSTESPERTIYNYCAARVARILQDRGESGAASMEIPGILQTYQLEVATSGTSVAPTSVDLLVPSSWIKLTGLKLERIRQEGFGMAMVGHQPWTQERATRDPMMPPFGFATPLNATLRFSGSQATLVLENLLLTHESRGGGQRLPLAGDFTAPLAFIYYHRKKGINKMLAMFRPSLYEDTMKLYSLEPFRKDKIPLLLVHGLMSTAEGWLPFVNLLREDPVLREQYQLIFFNYPTGIPISESAAELRKALVEFGHHYDPTRSNPNMRNMVILGHSMGGILANMQIRDSGNHLEKAVFARSLEDLDLDEERKEEIHKALRFSADPDIDRAILLAAPHRGSAFATNPIGQFGAWLIRLPFDIVDGLLGDVIIIDAMTNIAQEASQRPRNSVTSLRPDSPLLGAVLEMPVKNGLPVHSIIAQRNSDDPKEEGGDGVVLYTSSHLDEARSEVVVLGANHRSMVMHEETVQEVLRILYLHAGVRAKAGPRP